MWNAGAIIGALIIGVVAEFSGLDFRTIIVLTSTVSITAIFFIPIRMKNEFKNIYNQDV